MKKHWNKQSKAVLLMLPYNKRSCIIAFLRYCAFASKGKNSHSLYEVEVSLSVM